MKMKGFILYTGGKNIEIELMLKAANSLSIDFEIL